VTQGLVLTAVGMGLVFLALGLFLALMLVMPWLLRERGKAEGQGSAGTDDAAPSAPSEAEVAAMGAALAIWMKSAPAGSDPQLGASLAVGSSPWGRAAREMSHSTSR
jgi:Na+-transporting methylmalonyl-CoA/oxaloacetate decarboxylase gamma subunit